MAYQNLVQPTQFPLLTPVNIKHCLSALYKLTVQEIPGSFPHFPAPLLVSWPRMLFSSLPQSWFSPSPPYYLLLPPIHVTLVHFLSLPL